MLRYVMRARVSVNILRRSGNSTPTATLQTFTLLLGKPLLPISSAIQCGSPQLTAFSTKHLSRVKAYVYTKYLVVLPNAPCSNSLYNNVHVMLDFNACICGFLQLPGESSLWLQNPLIHLPLSGVNWWGLHGGSANPREESEQGHLSQWLKRFRPYIH